MRALDEEYLRYYWEELSHLRQAGAGFARAFPKVAARLELGAGECPDPHVERLIEAFAFLTARIRAKLDNDFPEIAAALLEVLYPHLVQPIPSFTLTQFVVDPERGKLTGGFEIPRGTGLFAHPVGADLCRFRTTYPVTLWPVELTAAASEAPARYDFLDDRPRVASVLRLRLVASGEPFEALSLDTLRVFLHGDPMLVGQLYELLFNHVLGVAVESADGRRPRDLAGEPIRPVGFGPEEAILPYPAHAQPAYRLLQEYFAFPEKHHFFDLAGLAAVASGRELDVLILLDQAPPAHLALSAENFLLGVTPVVNLFPRVSEPLRIDHRRLEYRLVADQRRERTTEIHSITRVSSTADDSDTTLDLAPFFSFTHAAGERGQRAFWHARRVPALSPGLVGTDLLLSFLDLDFKPSLPASEVIFAHTLCTNRGLAEQMPAGALLDSDVPMPIRRAVALKKPTAALEPPLAGETLWRLVSHLSLNYLSLANEPESVAALRELLRLYCPSAAAAAHQQIAGVRALAQRKVVRRLGVDAWRGFVRGIEVTVTLEEGLYVGGSAFLLGAVLRHFFALWTETNSFTQLVLKSHEREGVWKQWPPMAGARPLL